MMARGSTNDRPARRAPGRRLIALLVLVGLTGATAPAAAARVVSGPSGVRAVVHDAAEVARDWLVVEDGRILLRHPVAGDVVLESDTPWDTLHPLPQAAVSEALASVAGFASDLEVQVFLLPGLPAGVRCSFARRDAIFLAPARSEATAAATAYIVTHELGHVLTWAALDGRPERWSEYRRLRDLPAGGDGDDVPHAWREREILAEDLRCLFGGPLAVQAGTIENGDLALPAEVAGLRGLLRGYLEDLAPVGPVTATASRAFPNPCNPRTTVELRLPAAGAPDPAGAVLAIHDARGRLVRRIAGGRVANGRLLVAWNGRDDAARPVASGRYFYVLTLGNLQGRGGLVLVR